MIHRSITPHLIDHLDKKEITILAGARQAGKTTLTRVLRDYCEQKGLPTLDVNLDRHEDAIYFQSQIELLNYIKLRVGDTRATIFIDEIQRLKNAGLFFKGLYDRDVPYKFVVTGSGSLELKEKIHESLAGRKRIFYIPTITLEEFVHYKTHYAYINNLHDFFIHDKVYPSLYLTEYMQFGGYPRVVLAPTIEEKTAIMDDIYSSYVEKDIVELLNIQKTETFLQLVTLLASQVGGLVNYTEISNTLDLDIATTKLYMWYLTKTFIAHKTLPYAGNIRKEITKMPVYHFNDIGLRNFSINRFTYFNMHVISGLLFQNIVYQLLSQSSMYALHTISHWRSRDGAEVDFVLSSGIDTIPIEVKYTELDGISLSRSLKSYIDAYKPAEAYIIHLGLEHHTKYENTQIHALPYYAFIPTVFTGDQYHISGSPGQARR